MATPNEKLAESLAALQALQKGGRRVFQSDELSRVHRERLLRNGFLQEVMKGWIIASSPSAREGDSTLWYASFWEFCGLYCNSRFGAQWHLSHDESLLLHAENTVIPTQVVVYSPTGANNTLKLLFGTSIYDLKQAAMPPAADLTVRDGLRLFSPAAALVKVTEAFFVRHPIETQVVLASIVDAADVLRLLLNGGHSKKAGQIAAAYRRIGRPEIAGEIVETMQGAGYDVRESDPFSPSRRSASCAPRPCLSSGACKPCGNRCVKALSGRFRNRPDCRSPSLRICTCRRNLPVRRLSLAVHRRLFGHSGPD